MNRAELTAFVLRNSKSFAMHFYGHNNHLIHGCWTAPTVTKAESTEAPRYLVIVNVSVRKPDGQWEEEQHGTSEDKVQNWVNKKDMLDFLNKVEAE